MIQKSFIPILALILALPSVALAGAGSGKGRYGLHNITSSTTEMPDDRTIMVSHYHQVVFADDPAHPLDETGADCVGQFIMSGDQVLAASGACYGRDAEGDGFSYWWRMDKGGTADCPDLCGSFGYFDGYGKYKGITGKGTWVRTSTTPQGGAGTWEGSYSIE